MKTLGISKMGLNDNKFYNYLLNVLVDMKDRFEVEIVQFDKQYDFILFDGGDDVTPSLYGEEKNIKTGNNEYRDKYEASIFMNYLNSKTKFAGICRGSQFLNVMSGGTLYQDLYENKLGHTFYHTVELFGQLANLFPQYIVVNSTHHQAVKKLGDNLEVMAREDFTKIIEAYKSKDDKIRAVQFHPEFVDGFKYSKDMIRWLFRVD